MSFPATRMRRLRATPALRDVIRETALNAGDLLLPIFVHEGEGRAPIGAMPGVERLSVDEAVAEAREVRALGIAGLVLFGIPDVKDAEGSQAWAGQGVIQRAIAAIKAAVPELLIVADLCLCEYTDHGHCGILHTTAAGITTVDNDASLPLLARTAVAQAQAGADVIAPSDMMDGRVAAIRAALDDAGYQDVPIMSYSSKFASAFYGPFREAADSTPSDGDRRGYQMDPANGDEAVRESLLDVEEGADILMVKPALPYLDVIWRVKQASRMPVCAYNVSGEYAMVKAAAAAGHIDERAVVLETLTAIRRAGADIVITYHAKDAASWLQ
ncbi:MAG: delta-aminolevulinic acid dehydratase [Solirubrobacterales bacterium]|nr:delta-aminolevulinic acid dehydratase [Solirubrobacterales bacterium]